MFLDSSRYYKQESVVTSTKNGRQVKAITLRKLPSVLGKSVTVKGNDRLDIIAFRQYDNSTMFWHIADANTELDVNNLIRETGRLIKVPEK